jgi:TP901 family phage tail tape measure protein
MAFKLAELFVQITGQDSGLRRTLAVAHNGLLDLAGVANSLGALGVFGAAGSLTLALGVSAKVAIDLEKKFIGLQKATDLDPSGMKALEGQLQKLATTMPGISYDNLIAIATTGAKMGIAAGDLAEYTAGIAKVSTAMDDIPAEQIADQIGKINAVMGLGVQGAMQLGSAIDKLADSGSSGAADILNITQRLSAATVVAKISAAETTALAAALLDTGTQAELGASALGRIIMALNEVDSRKGFAKVLGISAEEFAAKVKAGPMETLTEFLKQVKTLDASSQIEALKGIGIEGVQGIGEIQKLVLSVDKLGDYTAKANHEFATLDQVNKSYAASSAGVGARIEMLKNQILLLGQKIGDFLMPAIRVGINLLSGLTTTLSWVFENVTMGVNRLFDRFNQFPAIIDSVFGEGTIAMIQGLGTAGLDFLYDKIERVGIFLRNFPDFFDIFVLSGQQAFMNLQDIIAVLPMNLAIIGTYIRNNWSKLIVDGVNIATSAFKNMLTNIGGFLKAVKGFMNGEGFQFEWTDLTKDFQAQAAQMPGLVDPVFRSIQDQIDEKIQAIGGREFKATQAAKLSKDTTKTKAPAGDGATLEQDGKKKSQGSTTDIASFARSLQEAASGKGKAADLTARNTQQAVEQLKKLNNAINIVKPATAVAGAGWQAAGLA